MNYELDPESDEHFLTTRVEESPRSYSRNFLCVYDATTFENYLTLELNDLRYKPGIFFCENIGMEDCKLFIYENQLWCSFTSLDHNHSYACPEIGFGVIECLNCNPMFLILRNAIYPKRPNFKRPEKNRLPFIEKKEKKPMFIYSLHPFIIKNIDLENGSLLKHIEVPLFDPLFTYEDFRNSAGPLETDDKGWLFITHEVCHQRVPKKRSRIYTHRFLWYNSEFVLTKMSFPFYFWTLSVEYCNGMSYGETDNSIVLSVGKFDKEAHLLVFDKNFIFSLLHTFNPKSLQNQYEPFYS